MTRPPRTPPRWFWVTVAAAVTTLAWAGMLGYSSSEAQFAIAQLWSLCAALVR